jgi:hypothetical protein
MARAKRLVKKESSGRKAKTKRVRAVKAPRGEGIHPALELGPNVFTLVEHGSNAADDKRDEWR